MKKIVMISLLIFICIGLYSDNSLENYIIDRKVGSNGSEIIGIQVPGGRPPKDYVRKEPVDLEKLRTHRNIVLIDDVPAFDWSYGCSATSAAMIAAYYDRNGYPNIYTGPTNGGVMPLDNSFWNESSGGEGGDGECPLSATHQGFDGLTSRGHVDNYWVGYGSEVQDPYITNGWTPHTNADCTGDFMGTNQSYWSNTDASTTFYHYTNGSPMHNYSGSESANPPRKDGTYGFRQFMESRGYDVTACYSQNIFGYTGTTQGQGFTFAQYKAEIDANRPVLIHVIGHTMVGFGYDSSNQTIYIKNTWDYSTDTMTWGEKYSNMLHYGVSIVNLGANNVVLTGDTFSKPIVVNSLPLTTTGNTKNYTNTVGNLANDVFYKINLPYAVNNVTISTNGSSFDTYLRVYNASQTQIYYDNNGGNGSCAELTGLNFTANTTYYVCLEGDSVYNGSYSLDIRAELPILPPTALTATVSGQNVTLNWLEPENSNSSLPYKVWRFLSADEVNENNWTLLTSNAIDDLTYTDTEWSTLTAGFYKYAVKAVYPNDIESEPAISNRLDNSAIVGTGTELDPYLITDLTDLYFISENSSYWASDVYIEQTTNIDASATQSWNAGKGFSPIGLNINFQGSYNGKGHTISNLYINRPSTNNIGLFGNIHSANISNIGLVNAQIVGNEYVGGLASSSESSTISNSYVTGSVNAEVGIIGGLIGLAYDTTISNSYATCSVSGTESVGGLVGVAWETNISNSYATGLVSGSEAAGGLIGEEDSNTVLNSFWDMETTGQISSSGGTGKTTAEMKDIHTYLNAGWDFARETANGTEDIWSFIADDYPHLSWEGLFSSYFIVNQNSVFLGETVEFINLSSGTIDEFQWEFGDGNSSTEENPTHTYQQVGNYTVSLTIENESASVVTIRENYITVIPGTTVEPAQGTLYISEVSDAINQANQYIELYNSSSDTLSIAGLNLKMDEIDDFFIGSEWYVGDEYILPHNFLIISRGADRVAFEGEFNALPEGVTFLQGVTNMLFGEGEGYQWKLILDNGAKAEILIDDTLIPVGGAGKTSYPLTFGGNWETETSATSTPGAPHESQTLPVTLASFNAIQTANNLAQISWVTASETNLLGYNIYRAEADNQNEAIRITPTMIEAHNEATGASYSYVDKEVESGATYYYWLETNDFDATSAMVGPVTVKISSDGEDHDIEEILLGTQLFASYPNPFNPSTTLSFSVAEPQVVTINVYNLKGQLVRNVFDKKIDEVNVKHSVVWNGQDSDGHSVASGVYFTIMKAGNKRFTNKAILMK